MLLTEQVNRILELLEALTLNLLPLPDPGPTF
jgi:hypothetical protein